MTVLKKTVQTLCYSTVAACVLSAAAAAETSVALVLPGSIGDGGWNQGAYVGLTMLDESEFKVAFSENVSQADIPSVVQGYADDGFDLIIGHGFQFGSLMAELAPEYPDQAFFATTSAPGDTEIPENTLYLDYRYPDLGYAVGVLAALLSDSGKIGVVGGGDNPTTQNLATGYADGAAKTVDGTTSYSIVTGDYNDAAKGREAATTMIGNGADVIWHSADITGIGAVSAAAAQKVTAIGMFSDQTEQAPEVLATSLNPNNTGIVQAVAGMVAEDSFEGGTTWVPDLGMVWLTVYGDGSYNPAIVSDADWETFKKAWSTIK